MQVGFFFWPFNIGLVERLADRADRYGYDMIGIADTPGNAMDPWVAATLVARRTKRTRVAICVTNLVTRHPSVTAAATASLGLVSGGRAVVGIGAGHSGTRNLGQRSSTAKELGDGATFIKTLLRGEPASLAGASAHMPWVKQPSQVFLAASHPRGLQAAGATADGAFVNFGLDAENIAQSEARVLEGVAAAGRAPGEVEMWQIAALDCMPDRDLARAKVGAMLAFLSGYVIGDRDLDSRGVPPRYQEPLLELRRRYSTRPGEADIRLVQELGLFDYLSRRLSVCGSPEECRTQALAARDAGAKRLMFTVSLAADPVRTVELFGEHVLPELKSAVPA